MDWAQFHAAVERISGNVSGWLWGWPLLVLLLGTHLFLTIRLGFIQRYLGKAIRLSFGTSREGQGDISQFGALTTALAATIGTGNIMGVCTAVTLGGPGAVLWMWLTGVFGIATKYAEALLSVHYRVQMPNGQMAGGPMYVLHRGLNCRWLAILFAVFTAIAAFGIGNMVQANAVAALVHESLPAGHTLTANSCYGVPLDKWLTGLIITVVTAMVILGGIKSIARVCEALVPFMAIFYVLGCLVLLICKFSTLGDTLSTIVTSAFGLQAAAGGLAGFGLKEAIRFGVARGLFSNESGLGSAPIVAAAAQTKNPVRQALVSSTGTFWDTVVVCAMTGLVVVNAGFWTTGDLKPAALCNATFGALPVVGPIVLVVGTLTFVFSTILGWSYYGEKAVEYLFGTWSIRYYRFLWVAAVMLGSVTTLGTVWNFADIANACMAVPNLVSLILLSGVVAQQTNIYIRNLDASAPTLRKPAEETVAAQR